jgi:diacylglycerol kinase family enzyme
MDPIAVLFNPSSGRGRSQRSRSRIEARLGNFGIPYRWFTSRSESHLKELALRLSQEYGALAVVGGDTSFTLAAAEVIRSGSDAVLGMVGTGSANDISRGLQVYDLDEFCGSLRSGRIRRMDAGCLELPGRPEPILFMGALSLGLGVEVNLYIARARRRLPLLNRGGSAVQALTGAIAVQHAFVGRSVPARIRLETDLSSRDVEYSLIVFANTPFYANGMRLFPEATPFDGRIHCCTIRTRSLWHSLRLSRRIPGGSHVEQDEVDIVSDTAFRVIPDQSPLSLQLDGDVLTGIEEFRVSVRPGAVRVVTASGD